MNDDLNEENIVYHKTDEQLNAEFEAKINNRMKELGLSEKTRMSEWRREDAEPKIYTFHGYPDGQPTNGYCFHSRMGGFSYSDNGGPSSSLSLSFGDPFGVVSFSTNLGTATPSASVSASVYRDDLNPNAYYKLAVTKRYTVKPYIIYTREYANDPWVAHHYTESSLTSVDLYITIV